MDQVTQYLMEISPLGNFNPKREITRINKKYKASFIKRTYNGAMGIVIVRGSRYYYYYSINPSTGEYILNKPNIVKA